MQEITIKAGEVIISAQLNDSSTAQAITAALPIEGQVSTWGDEIYFSIPVTAPLESGARVEVESGELGYWPPGRAFCIFFGKTPASTDEKPRAASPVTIIGAVTGDASQFKTVSDGQRITIRQGDRDKTGNASGSMTDHGV